MKGMYTLFDSKKSLLQLTSVSNNFDFSQTNDQRPVESSPEPFFSLKGRYRFKIFQVGL